METHFKVTMNVKVKGLVVRPRLVSTPWTIAQQAPLSMEFFRLQYWNGLPFPPLGVLLIQGIEPRSPALQADSLPSETPGKPRTYIQIHYLKWPSWEAVDLILSFHCRSPKPFLEFFLIASKASMGCTGTPTLTMKI